MTGADPQSPDRMDGISQLTELETVKGRLLPPPLFETVKFCDPPITPIETCGLLLFGAIPAYGQGAHDKLSGDTLSVGLELVTLPVAKLLASPPPERLNPDCPAVVPPVGKMLGSVSECSNTYPEPVSRKTQTCVPSKQTRSLWPVASGWNRITKAVSGAALFRSYRVLLYGTLTFGSLLAAWTAFILLISY